MDILEIRLWTAVWSSEISCWNCSGRAILWLNVRLEENEQWLIIFENLREILLIELLQIAHWMRQWFQLVTVESETRTVESETIKESRWELKSNNKLNAVQSQVCQLANRVWNGRQLIVLEIESIEESDENWNQMTNRRPYLVRFVSCPIESGTEVSWLSMRLSLTNRTNRTMRIEIRW